MIVIEEWQIGQAIMWQNMEDFLAVIEEEGSPNMQSFVIRCRQRMAALDK